MLHLRRRVAGAAVALVALTPAVAHARPTTRFERIAGYRSPGTPAKYDRVGILKIGSPKARNVLVLNPGTFAGAAYFQPLADAIVARAPGWQVWSVERRENLLEDQSVMDRAKAGRATARQLFDYYLGWLKDASIRRHLQPVPDSAVPYAKQWGMNTEVQDLRRVVLRAEHLGGKVVVGGHSLGGTITTAYATWDFGGRPGADGLSGLVFIDGGSSPVAITAEQASQRLADLQSGSPWLTVAGIPAPYAGLLIATGSLSVKLEPRARSLLQESGLLPSFLVPPVPVTTAGQYGYALDTATSPAALALAQAHLGHLATTGRLRDWVDDHELTPIQRFATMFGGWGLKGLDGAAWYHPLRLTVDGGAVADGNANDAQPIMDVHATHGHDLPKSLRMYAFAASLGGTRVLDAARALARQSGIPSSRLVLVDRHTTYAHNDPNSATPSHNVFLKHLIPFLRRVARG